MSGRLGIIMPVAYQGYPGLSLAGKGRCYKGIWVNDWTGFPGCHFLFAFSPFQGCLSFLFLLYDSNLNRVSLSPRNSELVHGTSEGCCLSSLSLWSCLCCFHLLFAM